MFSNLFQKWLFNLFQKSENFTWKIVCFKSGFVSNVASNVTAGTSKKTVGSTYLASLSAPISMSSLTTGA